MVDQIGSIEQTEEIDIVYEDGYDYEYVEPEKTKIIEKIFILPER